ncbi:tetratricopeptide repeat protein [Roseimicrobium gellanilyticum]|uniref:Tetratricopeptide repeat protein n=1 Tax=Roseimicrobium gellanilyticum TaxID=748857 RepID=A0A366HQT5_9BACT|nr:tetratricopeptide repeat protein [Roseimicrobium gellanilyticum]RBP46022.1 tetratricopeptide repeat protein [Roseimicrobium gellanilyticum]
MRVRIALAADNTLRVRFAAMNQGIHLTLALAFLMLAAAPATQAEPPEKARRYLDMLRQRPQFGVVFERFLDAWYEESTPDALAEHLRAEAAKPEAKSGDHLLLALFETRRGDEAAAVAAFKKGLALEPANPLAWQELARLQVRMLDFSQALESLDKALQQKPDGALAVEIEKQRGRVLLRTGKPEDALTAWRKLLEAHADDEDLAEEVVDVQLDEGLYTEAVALMESLIEKTKDAYARVNRRMRLADIYLRAGMKAEALEQLAEVIRQSGHNTWIEGEALAQTDQIFRREDNLSGLAGHLDKLAKQEDQRVAIKRHLARVSAETGLKDQAFTIYKDLLSRTPGRRDLREGYLDLLERFGNFTEAIPQTKLLLEQNPGDKELHLRLAAQQQHAGDPKAASTSLDAYLAAPGSGEYDYLRVAMQLEAWGRKDDARTAFEKLVVKHPDSVSAKEAQAHFLHRIGEKEQALTIWMDLAAKGDQEQVLAVAQALLARLEAKTAYEVLRSRMSEFGKDPRYLAPLLTAAITVKEQKTVAPLAVERVRLTLDSGMLEDAIRQAVQVLEGAQEISTTAKSLQGQQSMSIAERCLLATLLEEMGEKESAERTLREAGTEHALLAQTRLVGLIETRQDWPRASQEMEKLIAMPEGRTSQHLQRLVDLKERSGEPEAALKVATEWKTLSPGAVQPWLTEATLLTALSRQQDAIKILRAASRKFEDDDNVAAALASAYSEAGQFGDAERIFMRLVEKAESLEDKIRWVGALAQAASSRNTLKQVTESFRERQRNNREDATPWLALAEIAKVSSDQAEQRRCLLEAARLRPKDIDLLHQIARVEEDTGDFKQSLQTLEKAAALDTGWRTKQAIAMAHLRAGDDELGFRLLGDLMGGKDIEPKDALRLVDAMMAREHWDKAIAFLTPLVDKHSEDYRLRYLRGIALFQNMDNAGAIAEFLRVAAAKQEVPDVLRRPPTKLVSPWETTFYGAIEKTSPPGAVSVYRMTRNLYEATQYRMRAQYSGMMGSGVRVPGDVESARTYALANLMLLNAEEAPEGKARIASALEAAGIEHVAVLMSFEPSPQAAWNMTVSEDALRAHPADTLLHMFWVDFNNGNNNQSLPIELCQRAFDLLQEKYPLPAFRAAAAAVRTAPEAGLPMLEKALASLEGKQDPTSNVVTELSQMLGGGQNATQSPPKLEAPEAVQKKMLAVMVNNILKSPAPKPNSYDFSILYASNACRAQGAWEAYVTLWNHHLKVLRSVDPTAQKQLMAWSYGGGQNQKPLLRPLLFPSSDTLPGLFIKMMHYSDPFNPHVDSYARSGPEDDYTGIVPFLDRVEDPSMRLALSYKASQTKRLEEDLKAHASREDASPNDLLMAASYAGTTDNLESAATYLLRMQSFPMDAVRRAEVDAALVHAVTNLKEKPPQLLEAGQQAARRLRSAKLDARQREDLAEAFATLGLKEEAEQWRRLATLTPAPAQQRSYGGSYSSQSSPSRLDTAIAKGNHTEAVKIALSELKNIKSQYWDDSSGYAVQEGSQLVKKLTFPDARVKLIAAMDPGEDAPVTRREEFAALLELVEEKERARKIYEEILQKNANAHTVRIRLLAITAHGDPDKAGSLLLDIPLKAFNQSLDGTLLSLCNEDELPPAGRIAIFNALSAVLEQHAGDDAVKRLRSELDWIQELPPLLGRRTYGGGKTLPYMFDRDPYADKRYSYVKPDAPELKQRRDALNRLCKAMMLHPRLAASGFSWYAALALSENGNAEELATLATSLVEKSKAHHASGVPLTPLAPRRYSFYEEYTAVWHPHPVEFLIWHAWKNGRTDSINSEILPMAQQIVDRSQLNFLKTQARMWTCEPAEFATAAESVVRAANVAMGGSHRQTEYAVWLTDRWKERKIPGPVLDKSILSFAKASSGYNEGNYIRLYLKTRQQLAPEADTGEFLKQLLATMLGPQQNRWQGRMLSFANVRYGRGGSYNDRDAYNAGMILSALAEHTETKGIAVQAGILTGLINHAEWVRSTLGQRIGEVGKDAKLAMDFLEKAEFLGEAPQMRVVNDERIVHEIFLAARQNTEVRKAMTDALKSKPRSFGVELAETMLQQNQDAALSAFLKRRKADLATIPPDRIAGLASLIRANMPAAKNLATLDVVLKDALQPIFAAELAEQKTLLDKWMTAKRMQDLQLDDNRYEDALVKKFVELSESDPPKAIEYFNHACKLMETKESTMQWTTSTASNGWTLRSNMLAEAMKTAPKMRMLGLSMRLYHEDTSGNLTMNGWSHDAKWGQPIQEAWKNAGGLHNNEAGLQGMLTALQKELGDTPHTFLPLAFYDFFNRLPLSLRIEALRWAEKPTGDPSLAPLAKELALAGRFFLATENGARSNPEMQKALAELGGVEPVWQHEAARLRDEKLHPRARLAVAHHLCYRAPEAVPADVASVGAKLALEAQQKLQCMHGYQYGWLLKAWCRLPATDEWKNEAQEHWAAWKRRNDRKVQSRTLRYEPHEWPIVNMLRVAAHAGNEAWMAELQVKHSYHFQDDPSGIAILAGEGRLKEALDWTRAGWSNILLAPENGMYWNAATAQAVTQLRTFDAEPDIRFLCEVILSNLPDPIKPEQASIPNFADRRKRMVELAKRMKDITFSTPELKRTCAEEFAQYYYCYEPLATILDEVAEKVDIPALAKSQNSNECLRRLRPVVASVSRKIWNGDAKPAIAAYDKALSTPDTLHEYYRRSAVKHSVGDVLKLVPSKWSSQEKPDRSALLALVDHILAKTPDTMFEEHVANAITLKILIHHLDGHPEAIAEWRKTLTVDRTQKMKTYLSRYFRMWTFFDTMNLDAKFRMKPEERAALIGALLKDEWIGTRYPDTGTNIANLISTLTKDKALKPEDIPVTWKVIAEAYPRKGRTASEAADVLAQRGMLSDALAAFDLAISQASADYATSAAFICRKAELLRRLKRDEEAAADLLALDEKKMGPGGKAQRAALLKSMENEAKPGQNSSQ